MFIFVLQGTVEALQTVTVPIRASDGHVYEIQYTVPADVKYFNIHSLNGNMPSRDIVAELYIATKVVLNLPPLRYGEGTDLEAYISDLYEDTVKKSTLIKITKLIGTAPYKLLLDKLLLDKLLLAKVTAGTTLIKEIPDIAITITDLGTSIGINEF